MENKKLTLAEAFQSLKSLTEDVFEVDEDGIARANSFINDDIDEETDVVIDPLAQTEDELQDSYMGKVILDCIICQSKIYKDPEEVTINEDGSLANVGEICPYCQSSDGFKVIGQVAPYKPVEEDKVETEVEVDPDDDSVEVDIEDKEDEDLDESYDKSRFTIINVPTLGNAAKQVSKEIKNSNIVQKKNDIEPTLDWALDFNQKQYKSGKKNFQNVLVIGEAGTGKSSIVRQWARDNNINLVEVRASGIDDTDLGGVISNGQRLASTKFDKLNRPNSVLFLDEYDRAPKSVRAHLLELVNDHTVPDPRTESGQRYLENFLFTVVAITANPDLEESKNPSTKKGKSVWDKVEKYLKEDIDDYEEPYFRLYVYSGEGQDELGIDEFDYDPNFKVSQKNKAIAQAKKFVSDFNNNKINDDRLKAPFYVAVKYIEYDDEGDDFYSDDIYIIDSNGKEIDVDSDTSLDESMENVSIETDKEKITVTAEPKEEVEEFEDTETMIAPVDETTESKFKSESEETEDEDEDDDYKDIDVDEFEEESFDILGEKYLKKVYENVKSFKTTQGSVKGNTLNLEGLITFKSGKQAKTNFVFESKAIDKSGRIKLEGLNKQLAKGNKAFTLIGRMSGNKFLSESLTYNYTAKDEKTGKSVKLYNRVTK